MTTDARAIEPAFYAFPEIQKLLADASRAWIYKLVADGELPAPSKIGGRVLWPCKAIDQWLAAKEAAGSPDAALS